MTTLRFSCCRPLPWQALLLAWITALVAGCASTEKAPIDSRASNPPTGSNAKVAAEALQLQGQPYRFGGESPQEGFDCSGLVYYVYNRHGIRLPRDTRSLAMHLPPIQVEQRQPGDLLFFTTDKPYSHVGIYLGEDRFVHAPSSRSGHVMVSDLNQTYWRERFIAVRRPQAGQTVSMGLAIAADSQCLVN